MYIRAAKTEAEEAGISTEGMANSVSELREEILSLTSNRVDIMLDDDSFKSTYQIIKELSEVWGSLSETTKSNITELIGGGVRNANVINALMTNMSTAAEVVEKTSNSAGSALAENEKVLDSIHGKINVFSAMFHELSQNLISSGLVKGVVDFGTGLLNALNTAVNVIDALGGLKTLLMGVASVLMIVNAQWIAHKVALIANLVITKLTAAMTFMRNLLPNIINIVRNMVTTWHLYATGATTAAGATVSASAAVQATIPVIGLLLAALTAVVGVIALCSNATEDQTQAMYDAAAAADETSESISTLLDKYMALSEEVLTNESATEELVNIQEQLRKELGLTHRELDTLIEKYGSATKALQEYALEELKRSERDLRPAIDQAKRDILDVTESIAPGSNDHMWTARATAPVNYEYGFQGQKDTAQAARALKEAGFSVLGPLIGTNSNGEEYSNTFVLDLQQFDRRKVEDVIAAYEYLGKAMDLVSDEVGTQNLAYQGLYERYKSLEGVVKQYQDSVGNLNANLAKQYMLTQLQGKQLPSSQTEFDSFRENLIQAAVASGEFVGSEEDIAAAIDDTLSKETKFVGFYADTVDVVEEATVAVKDFKSALTDINKLATGLDQLDSIYADIYDKEDFDWSSILGNEDFTNAFGGLGDAYDDFIKTVANAPDDISACQDAFDKLATSYILNSDALESVTDETRNATVTMLEQMGVADAASIVDARLTYNKELLRLQMILGEDATYADIYALYQECEAGSMTAQILAQLAAAKLLTNENGIQTVSDIEQLEGLAKSANATTASLLRVAQAKQLMAKAEKYDSIAERWELRGQFDTFLKYHEQAEASRAEAQKLLEAPLEYDEIDFSKYKVKYTGGSTTSAAKKSGSGSDKEKTWFEKQLSMHQHLVAMNQETQEEYLTWLNYAYKKAYDEGIIDLDDYYKYTEEVYHGLQDLFRNYLSDVEHEISMRENYDGEAKKIIELYEELIEKVEKEIADARARGLTDEDDYIQELQQKWQDYTGSIEDLRDEITESAKDALDELVDYRIDMLKQEIEDEKDALDKKLDNLKEFYDKQKEMLQEQRDEEKYLDEQTDRRKSTTDLQAELAMLDNDDSAWAQKRKLELKEEISTAQEDLAEFEKDHALDLALDALDKAYSDQEAQLQAEMDALEERLNDPEALYNKALEDIRKISENQLYYQMLMYNKEFGDGNDETVTTIWESAFGALSDYEKLFGELYKGVKLENATGVKSEGGWDNEKISGTNSGNQKPVQNTAPAKPSETESGNKTPLLTKGSSIQVKSSATHFGSKSGGVRMAKSVPGSTYTVYKTSGGQVLIGRNGVYTGWVNKSDIVGYKSGTDYSVGGLAEFDEEGKGSEYIFESADGNRYRMFGEGSKVLNADATNFLYDFATSGGGVLMNTLADLFGLSNFRNISRPVQAIEIHSGDIIVQGNANERTVSEIRRAQRENLKFVITEFNKLNR